MVGWFFVLGHRVNSLSGRAGLHALDFEAAAVEQSLQLDVSIITAWSHFDLQNWFQ